MRASPSVAYVFSLLAIAAVSGQERIGPVWKPPPPVIDHLTDAEVLKAIDTANGKKRDFNVPVWTPTAWIRHHATLAARKKQSFTIDDVTDEMRENVWRFQLMHSDGMWCDLDVSSVLIRDKKKTVVVKPVGDAPGRPVSVSSGPLTYGYHQIGTVVVKFRSEEVLQLLDAHEEFTLEATNFSRITGRSCGTGKTRISKKEYLKHLQ